MLVSEIKRNFKNAYDSFSFNFSNTQLNDLFARANEIYVDGLLNNFGKSLENEVDSQPFIKTSTLTPVSNSIATSSLPDYDRIFYVKPTYVVSGVTYSYPAKPITQAVRYSEFDQGTVRYPVYYLTDDTIVLEPSNTPTTVTILYGRGAYLIDFTVADYDVPITDKNMFGIIEVALRLCGASQREYNYQAAINNEANANKQQG